MFKFAIGTRDSFGFANLPRTPRGAGRLRSSSRKHKRRGAGKILLLGRIRELALYRVEYLEGKGYQVLAPSNKSEALDAIRHGSFDVAVLSYTLPNDIVLEYAQLVHEHCPSCPLIVITNKDLGDRSIQPDAIVIADDGPDALLRALRDVVSNDKR